MAFPQCKGSALRTYNKTPSLVLLNQIFQESLAGGYFEFRVMLPCNNDAFSWSLHCDLTVSLP